MSATTSMRELTYVKKLVMVPPLVVRKKIKKRMALSISITRLERWLDLQDCRRELGFEDKSALSARV